MTRETRRAAMNYLFLAIILTALAVPTAFAAECDCVDLNVLHIELRNAITLKKAFGDKIADLRELNNPTSLAELQRFAKTDARRDLEPVPNYKGPSEVDYEPYGKTLSVGSESTYTDQTLCKMTASSEKALKDTIQNSACDGIGRSVQAHEDVHQNSCMSRGFMKFFYGMNGADRAQEEVDAYEAEIKVLQAEITKLEATCGSNWSGKIEIRNEQEDFERHFDLGDESGHYLSFTTITVSDGIGVAHIHLEESGTQETRHKVANNGVVTTEKDYSQKYTLNADGDTPAEVRVSLQEDDGTYSISIKSDSGVRTTMHSEECHRDDCVSKDTELPPSFPAANMPLEGKLTDPKNLQGAPPPLHLGPITETATWDLHRP